MLRILYHRVLKEFDKYFVPKKKVIHERATFHRRSQREGESIEEYICSLYELSEYAEFAEKEMTIRDQRHQLENISWRTYLRPTKISLHSPGGGEMQVMGQFETVMAKNIPLRICAISNDTDSLLSRASPQLVM